jgi:SAM-dependent methyltransferase
MDDIARYNKERWEDLARAGVVFSRPALDLDQLRARQLIDPHGLIDRVAGLRVLCLASGGGQQSAAFGLLGAHVTVFDLSETQLERDRAAAAHYGLTIRVQQGDMRDLSVLAPSSFDVVAQPHSINFVPDAVRVFDQVARVVRPGGLYRVDCANPFVMGIDERDWTGTCYPLSRVYEDGAEVEPADPRWEVWDEHGSCHRVRGPRQFRHSLGTMINGLTTRGFVVLGLWELLGTHREAAPGTWDHFMQFAPPELSIWSRYGEDE